MEFQDEVKELVTNVQDGYTDALSAYIYLHKLITIAENAANEIKQLAINAADRYPEKSFEKEGVIVEKRNSPARWDYSDCEAIKLAAERVQKLQKIAQNGGVDPVTGEHLQAKKTEGKPTLAIKLLIK